MERGELLKEGAAGIGGEFGSFLFILLVALGIGTIFMTETRLIGIKNHKGPAAIACLSEGATNTSIPISLPSSSSYVLRRSEYGVA